MAVSIVLDMRPSAESRAGDAHLGARLVAGDEQALAEVYDRYSALVYGVARRVTCDNAAAEDVCQDVFVHLWQHADDFDPDRGTLRSWLGMLAHRRSVDWVRSHVRARNREMRSSEPALAPDAIEDTATVVVEADLGARARSAVASLPAAQREAVTLAFFGGHSYREVAELLGIPEGTAKSRLRLALSHLAAVLPAEEMSWT